jgi:hypothetical protein
MNPSQKLLFCTIPLFVVTAITARTFTGRVVDSETAKGLPGVSITLRNYNANTTTDQDGKFSFAADVSVIDNHFRHTENNTLKWQNENGVLALTLAPEVTTVSIYTLRGDCLLFRKRSQGSDALHVSGLPKGLYLLKIAGHDGVFLTVKWMNTGNNVTIPLVEQNYTENVQSTHAKLLTALIFEKQGYQKKELEIESDSIYESMQIKLKPQIGSRVFDDDSVRTYRLQITSANMAKLLDFSKLVTNTYTVNPIVVQARIEFDGRTLDSVGVRFRGDQSLWDCIAHGVRKKGLSYPQYGFGNGDLCAKFSMKFDFNEYNKDFRLYGLKALNFRSMSADPSKLHEKLGFSIFDDMGIVAPRVTFARLFVNDSLWGLFCVVEEIDGRFTKYNYPESGDGNLYKEIWPTTQLSNSAILDGLVTNNDPEDNPDISDFKTLRDVVKATDIDTGNFLKRVSPLVDIQKTVHYIVVDRAIMNFDGIMISYGGNLRHNYYWYHNQISGLLQLVPWDLDKVCIYPEPNFWTNNQPNGKNNLPNWNVVNSNYNEIQCFFDPGEGNGSYLVPPIDKDKFLRLLRSATWNDFHTQGRAFLDSVFTAEKLNPRIERWRKLIAVAVGEDPTIDSTEWSVMVDSLSHTIPLMRKNLQMMIDTLIVR